MRVRAGAGSTQRDPFVLQRHSIGMAQLMRCAVGRPHDERHVSAVRRCDSDRLLLLKRMRVVDASDQLRSASRRRSIVPALRVR